MEFKEFVVRYKAAIIIGCLAVAFILSCAMCYTQGVERVCNNSGGQLVKNVDSGKVMCLIVKCDQYKLVCSDDYISLTGLEDVGSNNR